MTDPLPPLPPHTRLYVAVLTAVILGAALLGNWRRYG